MGEQYDAPNQQVVRPDGSGPAEEGEGGSTFTDEDTGDTGGGTPSPQESPSQQESPKEPPKSKTEAAPRKSGGRESR